MRCSPARNLAQGAAQPPFRKGGQGGSRGATKREAMSIRAKPQIPPRAARAAPLRKGADGRNVATFRKAETHPPLVKGGRGDFAARPCAKPRPSARDRRSPRAARGPLYEGGSWSLPEGGSRNPRSAIRAAHTGTFGSNLLRWIEKNVRMLRTFASAVNSRCTSA
ncbi:MAG: hypothetical protein BroJett031_02290 [Betaproteobacteria bacterium]|nr:MAG: hypothetical protein BroJett031_02290 [Betaproteobacteria bacterium]